MSDDEQQQRPSADDQPGGADHPDDDTRGPENGGQQAPAGAEPDDDNNGDGTPPPGRREEHYRKRAAQLRGEVDQLRARLDARDAGEAERHASGRLVDGAELWQAASLADLRNDDGEIDPERIDAAVDELITRKPYLATKERVPRGKTPGPARSGHADNAGSFASGWARFLGTRDDRR